MKQLNRALTGGIGAVVLALCLAPTVASSQGAADVKSSQVLTEVADIPMPGPAVRFDYQSLDVEHGQLYISHMNAGQMVVFDTQTRHVVANLDGFDGVHGVLAVPQIGRVYASVTGQHQVAAVDMATLKTIGKTGPIAYPDGLAYAPDSKRVFVSDEHGGTDAVVDATSNKLIGSVSLGGGAGNTVYDSGSGHILVAVHAKNDLVSIDPTTMKIVGRYQLPGVKNPHGIALDAASHLAFIAGEENHSLAVLDLKTMKLLSLHQVGDGPGRPRFRCGTQASVCLCGIGYRYRLPGERDRAAFTWTAPHAACSHGLRRPEDSPGLFPTSRHRRPPNPQNHETSRSAVTARREALAHRGAGAG